MQAATAPKTQTVGINPQLHGYIRLLASLLDNERKPGMPRVGIRDLMERAGWEIVRENRERLERALGESVQIPERDQPQLSLAS